MIIINKKSQFAVEHLLVITIGLLVLIPTIYYFYNYSHGQTEELEHSQLFNLGNTIVNEAEGLYALGPPSKYSFSTSIPDIVHEIIINDGYRKEIIFRLEDGSDIVFPSRVDLYGPFESDGGTKCINDDANHKESPCWSAGIKKIKLVAFRDNINSQDGVKIIIE